MPLDRAAWRNVNFFDATTGEGFGGFYQKGSITDANLLWILGTVLLVVDNHWTVKHRDSGRIITPSCEPVILGDYEIDTGNGSKSLRM